MKAMGPITASRAILSCCALCWCLIAAPVLANPVADRIYEPVALKDTEVSFRGDTPETISARTEEGLVLEGAYWPPDPPNGDKLIIVFHGNSYNHLVMAARAEPLRIGGRGVLVASYRGFGDNPGQPSEEGLMRDAEAWVAKARDLHPEARLYLFGFSLGGAVALEMAARHEVEAVATMGAFTDLRSMIPKIARAFVRDRYDNLDAIRLVEEPVLLLHGSEDDIVDPSAAALLEQAGGDNVTVINLRGGKHWVPLDQLSERLWAAMEGRQS